MLNVRVLQEKRHKPQKKTWVEKVLTKVFLMPKPTEASYGWSRSARALLFTLNAKENTGCQVRRESSSYFPGFLEVSAWHWKLPGLREALTKWAQWRYLLTEFTFLHPGPKFLTWFWTKGQKEKSQDFCFVDLSLLYPNIFQETSDKSHFIWNLNVYFSDVKTCFILLSVRGQQPFSASFKTLSWQNQSHEKKLETS